MIDSLLTFMSTGLLDAPWWAMLLGFLVATQLTIFGVTLYLHRSQAHRAVDLHPVISHVFRFWLWLSTSMVTREWVAVHRKHHAHCETEEDPHSPVTRGIRRVVWQGAELYMDAKKDPETLAKYGAGTPDDWLERYLYGRKSWLGPTYLLFIMIALLGFWGVAFWALQMVWIPFFAAGVVNGLGHWWGYRNFPTGDASTNLTPWGVFIGGEELHNNHHAFPSSARFSMRGFEIDIGWSMLRVMERLGLAKVRRVAPALAFVEGKQEPDRETLRAVLVHRFHLMGDYFRLVMLPVVREEALRAGASMRDWQRKARRLLLGNGRPLKPERVAYAQQWLEQQPLIATVCEYRARLKAIWEESAKSGSEVVLERLRQWCKEAESSGIRALQDFARRLPGYALRERLHA